MPENTGTVTLNKTTAVPGDVVTLTSTNTLDNKPGWEVTLGGQKVALARVSDTQAAFIVPVVSSGAKSLDLAALGFKSTLTLTIGQYAAIQDPAAVFADFQSRLAVAVAYTEGLTTASTYPLPAQNLAVLKNLQQSLPAMYANATAAQKLEVAYLMRQMAFAQVDFGTLGDKATANDDPADRLSKMVSPYALARIKLVFFVGTMAVGGYVASPLVMLVGSVGMLYQLNQTLVIQQDILNTTGIAMSINDYSNRPAEGNGGTLKLFKDTPKGIQVEATYRTVQASDAQAGPELAKQILSGVEEVRGFHTRINAVLLQLKQWLAGSATSLSPFVGAKTQGTTKTMNIPARRLQVRNIFTSGITVTGTAPATGDVLTLKATSNTFNAVTPFTFELAYDYPTLSVSVKKTVTAEYSPVMPGYTVEVLSYDMINNVGHIYGEADPATFSVEQVLQPNDAFKAPSQSLHYYRLKYNGQYVQVKQPTFNGTTPGTYSTFAVSSTAPPQSADVNAGSYLLSLYDETNSRAVLFPVNLTFNNELYRKVVGRTIRTSFPSNPGYFTEVRVKADGTHDYYTNSALRNVGTWSISAGRMYYSTRCASGAKVRRKSLGFMRFTGPIAAQEYSPFESNVIEVYEDGTVNGTGGGFCNSGQSIIQ
ncbi:hypothetical protein F0P96_02140 [Hymenobacter busanensis]|uniref:Uncharacterized protein n=1 Tax=Hymenobacter busanensis TaxID=2607656 RepID=A0A7L4ZTS1_9BACT|nr:hypothetical protein [Hymenobacter busanensis]KAA9339443.1 hypothetical protein F0P96_02140 [Hymenobacter busanensis]QHJ06799.1 hypothetical protein GUY19_05610 [Hymenobacter busanensis]